MRFLLKCCVPMDKGNELARDGTLGQRVRAILEEIKPETAYFTTVDGRRGGYIVVDIDDPSQIPAIAEPLFLGLGATVEVYPVMTPEDPAKGAPGIERAVQRFG